MDHVYTNHCDYCLKFNMDHIECANRRLHIWYKDAVGPNDPNFQTLRIQSLCLRTVPANLVRKVPVRVEFLGVRYGDACLCDRGDLVLRQHVSVRRSRKAESRTLSKLRASR